MTTPDGGTSQLDDPVDWQRQVAEFASKSPQHSECADAAHTQVTLTSDLTGEDRWEATYTLAVQRYHTANHGFLAPEGGDAQ